ncbi:MAG: hypothetical protein FWE35_01765 [Streptosporangiales bacterium]|nr:hypothetical protein [Streptosporangiales bacterium]
MPVLASFLLADGSTAVTVESPSPPGTAPAARSAAVPLPGQRLSDALQPVTAAAAEVIEKFRGFPGQPDEVEIQLGVKLDGSFGALIASSSAGAHLDVTLRWTQSPGGTMPGS